MRPFREREPHNERASLIPAITAGLDSAAVHFNQPFDQRQPDAQTAAGSLRPFLTEEVEDVLRERTPLYTAAAHHIVETDTRDPQQVADEIARLWARKA